MDITGCLTEVILTCRLMDGRVADFCEAVRAGCLGAARDTEVRGDRVFFSDVAFTSKIDKDNVKISI